MTACYTLPSQSQSCPHDKQSISYEYYLKRYLRTDNFLLLSFTGRMQWQAHLNVLPILMENVCLRTHTNAKGINKHSYSDKTLPLLWEYMFINTVFSLNIKTN